MNQEVNIQFPLRVAIIGPGKIAKDQHLPSIAGDGRFKLVACVGSRSLVEGVPFFANVEALRASRIAIDAVAICTPPQVRTKIAREAIAAGWHVFLEKPPAATVSEAESLRAAALAKGITLLMSWHSRFAPQVPVAESWLATRAIAHARITWRENVCQWHPGQQWLWQAGGLGVFDPGINALSIFTRICPAPVSVVSARFEVPSNAATPIAAQLQLRTGAAPVEVDLDFRQTGHQSWNIAIETIDGETLVLRDGGALLDINGKAQPALPDREYPELYAHFAGLIATAGSDADVAPLQLVADAFLVAEISQTEAFFD